MIYLWIFRSLDPIFPNTGQKVESIYSLQTIRSGVGESPGARRYIPGGGRTIRPAQHGVPHVGLGARDLPRLPRVHLPHGALPLHRGQHQPHVLHHHHPPVPQVRSPI